MTNFAKCIHSAETRSFWRHETATLCQNRGHRITRQLSGTSSEMSRARSGRTRTRQKTGKTFFPLKFQMQVIESNHRYWFKLQELEHVVFFHTAWPDV